MGEISVIIPTYNESENIKPLIETIENLGMKNFDIVVVDDNSPDGTADIVKELNKKYGNLILVNRPSKLGIGSAIRQGIKASLQNGNKYIVTLDGDFSHDPKDIPRLLGAAQDADLIQGSRYMDGGRIIGWDLYRKMLSNGGNLLCSTLFQTGIKEHTTYFRVYSRKTAEVIVDNVNTNGFEFGVTSMLEAKDHNFKIKEVPITFVNRKNGKSKLKMSSIIKWNITIMKLFVSRSLKAVYKKIRKIVG